MATPRICIKPNCSNKVRARGLCSQHYSTADFRPACSIDGCDRKADSKGVCRAHRKRELRNGDPSIVRRHSNGTYNRWLESHAGHSDDSCLIWPFWRDADGYGPIRGMCEIAHGPAPTKGHQAAHSCGNGHLGCINPKHLRWATLAENRQDMIDHGRSTRGEKSFWAKLTEQECTEIKRLLPNHSNAEIGRMFGLSRNGIRSIRKGISWAWLKP